MQKRISQERISQDEIDSFFESDLTEVRRSSVIINVAKKGWAQPAMLSLSEVQELCKTLVLLETEQANSERQIKRCA